MHICRCLTAELLSSNIHTLLPYKGLFVIRILANGRTCLAREIDICDTIQQSNEDNNLNKIHNMIGCKANAV